MDASIFLVGGGRCLSRFLSADHAHCMVSIATCGSMSNSLVNNNDEAQLTLEPILGGMIQAAISASASAFARWRGVSGPLRRRFFPSITWLLIIRRVRGSWSPAWTNRIVCFAAGAAADDGW